MRRIKDFFYNKNDIIIVLIILAAAAFIIYTRIGVIMDYPEKLAADNSAAVEQTVTTAAEADKSDAGTDKSSGTASGDSDKNSGTSGTVVIKITDSDTSVTVAEKIADAGLVESATEFEGYITNNNKADKLQTGTFKIKKGSSFKEILNKITK